MNKNTRKRDGTKPSSLFLKQSDAYFIGVYFYIY